MNLPFELLTRPEVTEYRETSRYVDVHTFLTALAARTDRMRVESFGRTEEGREMLLVVLNHRNDIDPASAHQNGKPVVLIINNIHGGEVCGKEASQMLVRDLTIGPLSSLLDHMTVLIVPIYNIDGNERIDPKNRTLDLETLEGQYNPEGGVGVRYTAAGYDLNRDYIKQEAVETRNLHQTLYARWKPDLTIDCHATNGSIHSYHLTYAEPQNPSGAIGPIDYIRSRLLPSVTTALEARTGFRTFFYGNFRNPSDPSSGWETYPHLPRFGSHYRGLTNRMDILSEAYSYLSFRDRVRVTYEFLLEILTHTLRSGREMVRIVQEAERETIRQGQHPGDTVGIAYRVEAWDKHVEILSSQELEQAPDGTLRYRFGDTVRRYTAKHYARYVPIRTVPRPYAYWIPGCSSDLIARLQGHHIQVERLLNPLPMPAEMYTVTSVSKTRAISGDPDKRARAREETSVRVEKKTTACTAPAGDYLVRLAQPLGNLIVYLLEPESDDGLVTWNYLDADLKVGLPFPIARIGSPVECVTEVVPTR